MWLTQCRNEKFILRWDRSQMQNSECIYHYYQYLSSNKHVLNISTSRSILISYSISCRNLYFTWLFGNIKKLIIQASHCATWQKKTDHCVLMNVVSVLGYITTSIFIPTLQESKVKQMCHVNNNNWSTHTSKYTYAIT